MAVERLTDRSVATARAQDGRRTELRDATVRGLVLRVSSGGTKSWSVQTVHRNEKIRITLGSYPTLGLADARRKAQTVLVDLAQGRDPRAEKAIAKSNPTMGDLIEEYDQRRARQLKPASARERMRILRKHFAHSAKRKVVDLTRRDVVRVLDEVEENGAVARNRCLTAISALLSFAVDRGVLNAHPALGIRRLPETSRARVLADEELTYLWRRLDELQLARSTVLALKFVACTGCRPGEATGARWDEIEGALWTIPATRSKNGRAHEVPLSPMAWQVIAEARPLGGEAFLFPSPRTSGKPIGRLALSQALNRAQTTRKRAVIELPDTNPHDLRRTVATGLKRLGVAPHVVEEVLGHVSTHRGGLVGVYDRHDYAVEKRQALERWSEHLAGLIYGDGVEVLGR